MIDKPFHGGIQVDAVVVNSFGSPPITHELGEDGAVEITVFADGMLQIVYGSGQVDLCVGAPIVATIHKYVSKKDV